MLQIKQTLIFIIALFCFANAENNLKTSEEWLIEDAYENERIPLSEASFVLPGELSDALNFYHAGQYRKCIETLEKIRSLKLPDGQLDFISFVLAESYLQLKLKNNAMKEYQFVIDNFPNSDKIPACLFRLLEKSVENGESETADSVYQAFQKKYLKHPLFNSVLYSYGKLLYKMNRFKEAVLLLIQIPQSSSRYLQAQFIIALCNVQMNEQQKALMLLDYVYKNSPNNELANEAAILIGDIYYKQKNYKVALDYYNKIPKKAYRYDYAVVKGTRALLDLGNHQKVKEIARQFMNNNENSEFYFEMASILEQAYSQTGDERNATRIEKMIQEQIANVRMAFEIYQEIDLLVDLSKEWQLLEYDALRNQNFPILQLSQNARKKIRDLDSKYHSLLNSIHHGDSKEIQNSIPHLAERRYLTLIKKQMSLLEDSMAIYKSKGIRQNTSFNYDSSYVKSHVVPDDTLDKYKREYQKFDDEYSLIVRECLGGENDKKGNDEEMQAKYIDWAFMKYLDKKSTLKKIAEDIAVQRKNSTKPDSSQSAKAMMSSLAQIDYDKFEQTIINERDRLIDHIEMMQKTFKKNDYTPQILFRLAELYYDKAGSEFQQKLKEYERIIKENKDTSNLTFPDYNLKKVKSLYEEIISHYPKSDLVDDALYFLAMAQQKENNEDSANTTLLSLVEKCPESEYFVEANMAIGKYYFDHPKIENNSGYKLAEDAYRKVLYYRDHPQFVEALYHLGWCYYMQDRYEEAIAVFKYLIEEAKLDFDPSKMEEKQLANPLLRGEAIDYIAISFDEEGKSDDVLNFLKLVGNDDYSALVLKRIAELREEDLDINGSSKMYQRLISQYPLSSSAPDAYLGLIKLYDSRGKSDSAIGLRDSFFNQFCTGSKWNNEAIKKDSSLLNRIDSLVVATGLYIADANYRDAEKNSSSDEFQKAANNYKRIVDKYPKRPGAIDALWNLAVILDTKLFDKPQAYNEYMTFSKLPDADSSKREQAALNAIAISQSLLPADTFASKGSLDFSAEKVVESVNNYLKLFPNGTSSNKVLLGLGAIYFNRHLFAKAEEIYGTIVNKGPTEKEYYEALLYLGQCNFGEEKWSVAISAFEKIWKQSDNEIQKGVAYKFLLQSEFLLAKSHLSAENYDLAASAFRAIDDKYPGSEYGDVALFNAAEAYEKKEQWTKACDAYYDIVKRYPSSKFAPDGLFNAASDYEKVDKMSKAAETYELICSQYPQSDKAKDALFNLGLCYEKLGKMDEMAQVNERYSALYPGEKDVEMMLLRSGAYYAKTGTYDKAVNVYQNFIRRFPTSPKTIEAMFMIAKCKYDQGDKENALLSFNQAEQQNNRFAQENGTTNNYYASEAAYYSGLIRRDKFLNIKLEQPDELLKRSVKDKSDLLVEAVKAFQRVIQYQSERMFEAAYRVGQLYEDLSLSYKNQERAKLDPIKAAVNEKDILTVSSQLLQKSFIPYCKVIELSKKFDSLSTDQKSWIEKSKQSYIANCITAGKYLFDAVSAMNEAPIPKEVQEKPLVYYQYLKQLLETLSPMKMQVVDYYSAVLNQLDSMKLSDSKDVAECNNQYVNVNYLIGNGYDRLASLILKNSQDDSKNLSASEKEDLLFQLEDIVYELQDKAIFEYEDGMKRVQKRQLTDNPNYKKIIESLARLSPDKYGAKFYKTENMFSNEFWIVRSDSVANWNNNDVPKDGWRQVKKLSDSVAFTIGKSKSIWSDDADKHLFFWKNIFLNGTPRNASVYIRTPGRYNLFVNGSLTLKDTIGKRDVNRIDSASGIVALVKGGDNAIAIEAFSDSGTAGKIDIAFNAMIDTTQHFVSNIKLPPAMVSIISNQDTVKQKNTIDSTKNVKNANTPAVQNKTVQQFKSQKEVINAIENFKSREMTASQKMKSEQLEIRKIQIEKMDIETKLQKIKEEITSLKNKSDSNKK